MTTKANFDKQLKIHAKAYFNSLKNTIIKEWGKHALDDQQVSEIGKELLGSMYKGTFPIDKVPFTNTSMSIKAGKVVRIGLQFIKTQKEHFIFMIHLLEPQKNC